ncbi:class I SAM-dependent methyltransferase [Lusitaniella coriacea]|uniref:class I SAM-dependent methyltransferase n=1 Tax=Lusitaniella coriacea TaxID=1983105 RepID=UPI003CE701EB
MKDSEQTQSGYGKMAEIYRSAPRKTWYSSVADAYNRARPRYPEEFVRRATSQLPSDAILLEIGCGPGTATTAFANFGFEMVCLEPSPEACQLARENCQPYPNVEIQNTTFEDWELEPQKFHGILAATSFHWVSPEIRHIKAANALKNRGSLILLWNTPPQPNAEIRQFLQEIYQHQVPSLVWWEEKATHEKNIEQLGQMVIDSGLFEDLATEQRICEATYSIDDYLALLSTLSQYIALEPQKRENLFDSLREAFVQNGIKTFPTSNLSVLQIAKKRDE